MKTVKVSWWSPEDLIFLNVKTYKINACEVLGLRDFTKFLEKLISRANVMVIFDNIIKDVTFSICG